VNAVLIAVTRKVSRNIGSCELTHLGRDKIDVDLAEIQHGQYEACLAELGCRVTSLPAEPELPDSVFVEDTAVVFDEGAIITRPGAESRRPETVSVAEALEKYRKLYHIEPPGTVDGGDVLKIGKKLFVGLSARTNDEGIKQIRSLLSRYDYAVEGVKVTGCLHLKSAVTQVAENTLLINPAWVDERMFKEMALIYIDPSEPFGANALLVGNTVIYPAAYPGTKRRLESAGITVRTVDVSELAKAEGGVTCCSLIFDV
jgi:dimethylargininase